MRGEWQTLVAGALCCSAPCAAQTVVPDGFTLSGTTRVRAEAIDGQARAGFNEADELLNLRTTLMAQYRDGPVRLVAELWDSRVYGDDRGTPVSTGEVNALELVQAFAEAKLPGVLGEGSSATVQAGRFVMNLGSRRLVAADDYRNTTNGYTGIRADLGWRGGWAATLVYTLPQQRRPDDLPRLRRNAFAFDHEGFDLVLWGGLVSRARAVGPVTVEGSFFHLGERDRPARPTRDRSLDTISVRLIRNPAASRIDGEVEVIVQRGHASSGTAANATRQTVRAWFVHADAGYTFADPWKTRVSIEYDHASGDRAGGAYERFDTLFGMRRADLAPAGLYNAILRSNVVTPGIRIESVPDKRTDFMVSLRPMWLAAREDAFSSTGVRDASGRSGNFAGTQFDGRIRHQPLSWLRLELDAVLLAKGRFLRDAPNAPAGHWTRYVSMNATATF
ncbi:MAG: alginate export family protein [Rhizorhabdus sp.]